MRRLAALFLSLAFVPLVAIAARTEEAPPGRVGRISFVSGQLAFHTAGETAWSAAAANYPVAAGGAFWTDPQSRAEIRIGSQTIDLAGDTEVDIVRLDEQVLQIAVPRGRIDLHLRSLDMGSTVEIDIPRGGVWLLQPGVYDIDSGTADQPSRIAVFDGSAHFVADGADIGIAAGEAVAASGANPVAAKTERAAPDAFVQWCRARDYHPERLAAPYYLSPRMTGYEELDEYGTWRMVPDYGEVWFPSAVSAEWAPYRDGYWLRVEPWGWNWVETEPWGFAPFHYGRWARIDKRWAWVPGRFVPRPVYAPALVAFLGDSDIGLATLPGVGPAVGWFPLGPDEAYWPGYTRDPAYIRNINLANVGETKIADIVKLAERRPAAGAPPAIAAQSFANRAAATLVPVRAFATAARVAPAVLRVPPQAVQQASVRLIPPRLLPRSASLARPERPAPRLGHAPTPAFRAAASDHARRLEQAPSSAVGVPRNQPGWRIVHAPPVRTMRGPSFSPRASPAPPQHAEARSGLPVQVMRGPPRLARPSPARRPPGLHPAAAPGPAAGPAVAKPSSGVGVQHPAKSGEHPGKPGRAEEHK